MILLNPTKRQQTSQDDATDAIMRKTIGFFEAKGKAQLKHDDHERVWYSDFLAFQKEHRVFAQLLTPSSYADDEPGYRWDTSRNCEFRLASRLSSSVNARSRRSSRSLNVPSQLKKLPG